MTPYTYDNDEYDDDDDEQKEYDDDDEDDVDVYDDDDDDVGWYADSNPIRLKSSSLIIIIAETRSQ